MKEQKAVFVEKRELRKKLFFLLFCSCNVGAELIFFKMRKVLLLTHIFFFERNKNIKGTSVLKKKTINKTTKKRLKGKNRNETPFLIFVFHVG